MSTLGWKPAEFMESLHSGKNSAPPEDMFSPLSFPFRWKPVGELDEPKPKVASSQAILAMVRRTASLQKQEPSMSQAGDADHGGSYDDADGCHDDAVDVIDDGGDGGVG